ncbi:MAG TPA: PIG-L family deacetylase [Vicinamibacterales bacterium]|jgi:LmbE family N-acetylglucosaminyl deacetylase
MDNALRLLVVAAHPDDEALGFGGVLARYASEGVDTFLVTATRGERGRYLDHRFDSPGHPGAATLAQIRERELHQAANALGIREVTLLDYEDQGLNRAHDAGAVARIASEIRRIRPQVVLTFAADGAYGHPDHIAVSQLATAALMAAADAQYANGSGALGTPYAVSKFYVLAWNQAAWTAYESVFKKLVFTVDGVERQAMAWPDWALTTVIDTRAWWPAVWRAVGCHESQVGVYAALRNLAPSQCEAFWGSQSFYRVFSLVNGGSRVESDLFEGLR